MKSLLQKNLVALLGSFISLVAVAVSSDKVTSNEGPGKFIRFKSFKEAEEAGFIRSEVFRDKASIHIGGLMLKHGFVALKDACAIDFSVYSYDPKLEDVEAIFAFNGIPFDKVEELIKNMDVSSQGEGREVGLTLTYPKSCLLEGDANLTVDVGSHR